jgi:arylsulfatase A-like enzyme
MLCGSDIRDRTQLEPARIQDLAPTILYLLGLPIPADMDGQVITEAIKADLLNRRPVNRTVSALPSSETHTSGQVYSDEESQAVADRLRALGYL